VSLPKSRFVMVVSRTRVERRAGRRYARTVGTYNCYWDGVALPLVSGQVVERDGPGDNTTAIGDAQDRRIAAGEYPLAIQAGPKYRTSGYSSGISHTAIPRPGLLLTGTGQRTAILIHPARDYLWSVGCLNLASGLTDASSPIHFGDSRARVVAVIDAIRARLNGRFPTAAGATIPDAVTLIEGEP
jgi:hypothetical protein